jgi:putative glutathione S-transferase
VWDSKKQTIVSNESSEIIRFFNTAVRLDFFPAQILLKESRWLTWVQFDDLVEDKYKGLTFYPEEHRKEIDELNEWSVI